MRVLGVLAQNIRNHPFEVSGSSFRIQKPSSLPAYITFLSQLGDQRCGSGSGSAPKCHGSPTLHSKVYGNQNLHFPLCLMIEESGSKSLTNGSGCGSGTPKNIWILRIRIRNTVYNYYVERNMGKSTEIYICPCCVVQDAFM
jgi:hypothetical protein